MFLFRAIAIGSRAIIDAARVRARVRVTIRNISSEILYLRNIMQWTCNPLQSLAALFGHTLPRIGLS